MAEVTWDDWHAVSGLVQLFQEMSESGSLVMPEESARNLVARLSGVGTGDVRSFGA